MSPDLVLDLLVNIHLLDLGPEPKLGDAVGLLPAVVPGLRLLWGAGKEDIAGHQAVLHLVIDHQGDIDARLRNHVVTTREDTGQ